MQRNRIRLKEFELTAICGLTEHNADTINGLVNAYRAMLFPGSNTEARSEDKEMAQRKAALAREAQKAFIVKPIDIKNVMKRASDSPEYAKLAGRAVAEHERERLKQLQKKARAEREQAAARRKLLGK